MSATKICPQCGTQYGEEVRFCSRDGATLKSQDAGGDLVGSVVAERYHVTKKLGEGGMGRVYLAEHVRMGRKSAVKVMHPAMVHDADAIGRFNREAANASKISHPNVAGIYDFGETAEGLIYLAMEFVDGEPLTDLLKREGPLPAARAAAIVAQVADALAAAHDLGIVHRDLKPDNIMICRGRDGRDVVKVVDFGIAKAATGDKQNVTKTGLVVGTLEYMSPEQLAGGDLDGRSDLYSLAIVAFTSMTQRLPFPADTPQESMIMRLTEQPRRLAEVRPDLAFPAGVQAVLDRGLARDAVDRYASVIEFGDQLRAAAGSPTAAAVAPTAPMPGGALPPQRTPGSVPTVPASAPLAATVPDGRGEPLAHTRPSAPVKPPASDAKPVKRSALPVLLSVSAVVLLAAAGGAFYLMRGDGAPAGESAVAERPPQVAQNTDSFRAPTGATTATQAGTTTATQPAANADSAVLVAQLDSLDNVVSAVDVSEDAASRGAGRLAELLPRLRTAGDSSRALVSRALALNAAGETRAMCRLINEVVNGTTVLPRAKAVMRELRREKCLPARRSAPAY